MMRKLFALAGIILMVGCELKAPVQKSSTQTDPVTKHTNVTSEEHMQYLSGGEGAFDLADMKGSVVLLDVCASWSPVSRAHVEALNRFQARDDSTGLKVIGLVVDAIPGDGLTSELKEWGATYPLVATPRTLLSRVAPVRSVPARLLVDRKGQLRKHYAGIVSPEILQQDVSTLLKEP